VVEQALMFSAVARFARPALINGSVGIITTPGGQTRSITAMTIRNGKITEIDILADAERIAGLNLTAPD